MSAVGPFSESMTSSTKPEVHNIIAQEIGEVQLCGFPVKQADSELNRHRFIARSLLYYVKLIVLHVHLFYHLIL